MGTHGLALVWRREMLRRFFFPGVDVEVRLRMRHQFRELLSTAFFGAVLFIGVAEAFDDADLVGFGGVRDLGNVNVVSFFLI